MTKCPSCGYEWKDAGRSKGGSAKVPKGFADPMVQAKAQATRAEKKNQNVNGDLRGGEELVEE